MKSGLHELDKILRIDRELDQTASLALSLMADFVGARVGIIYFYEENLCFLETLSTYAVTKTQCLNAGFKLGEGLAGQVALERKKICINGLPADYLPITSALGKADPLNVVVMPIMHNDILTGVMELGSFSPFGEDDFDFLLQSLEAVAVRLYLRQVRQF
jgi:GAF domain-containing protein